MKSCSIRSVDYW